MARALARVLGVVLLLPAGILPGARPAAAATLEQVTDFGPNPSNISMYLYVPDRLPPRPAVLVAAHWCHGTAQDFHRYTEFAALADRHGFIVIYPSASSEDGCWDVASPAALSHDGGSDPAGIVSMVRYVLRQHDGDPERVYATGMSSGAMLTNVLLGAYPDVFAAGAAFAGVPFGCFAGPSSWNSDCAEGRIIRTPQEWGDAVRAAFPGWAGPRPRMQLWHGTEDDILRYPNFGEAVKQWTDVHGVGQGPASTDRPQPTWTRTRYADAAGTVRVEAVSMAGEPHNLPIVAPEAIRFFGLDQATMR